MKARNWGRIVFISSESGIHIPGDMVHYGFSKTAQLAVSRGIAETCQGTGVTCNAVLPGPTRSDGLLAAWARRGGDRPQEELEREFFRTARPSSLIQRMAEPQEVASMVAYVCSPLASATNGAALRVEGGIVRACF
jgi:NAD(P)-dependent dehydrogenase (short-subunit alcohol dehydrogenase family)